MQIAPTTPRQSLRLRRVVEPPHPSSSKTDELFREAHRRQIADAGTGTANPRWLALSEAGMSLEASGERRAISVLPSVRWSRWFRQTSEAITKKEEACEQFGVRRRLSPQIEKIDNQGLHAGSPMYFYCRHCGIPTEVLPEDFVFPPTLECSQCQGLKTEGWLESAIEMAG